MKILAYIHGYPPSHNAGAEWMLYDLVESLKEKHDITIMTYKAVPGSQKGVTIQEITPLDKYKFCDFDAVITHLDLTNKVYNIMKWIGHLDRLYLIIHNTIPYAICNRVNEFNVIYNSEYTAGMHYPQRNIICRPPLSVDRYKANRVEPDCITLVNCWDGKGGDILAELAQLMPDQKFIGVLGGYGKQVVSDAPNIEYVQNGANMADIYARTKIYIQPSTYESWGKAACEALCNDIPVICTDTPGLKESMAYAAIYPDRTAQAYKEAIEEVMLNYDERVKLAQKRTAELVKMSKNDLKNVEKYLLKTL